MSQIIVFSLLKAAIAERSIPGIVQALLQRLEGELIQTKVAEYSELIQKKGFLHA